MTEVTPDGSIVWEMKLASAKNIVAYRSHKYEWDPCARPTFQLMKSADVTSNSAKVRWPRVAGAVEYKLRIRPIGTSTWKELMIAAPQTSKKIPTLTPSTTYEWQVETWCNADGTKSSGFTSSKKFQTAPLKPMLSGEVAAQDIVIYPNPAHDFITVSWLQNEPSIISIIDVTGRKIKEMKVDYSEQRIDISELPTQLYLLLKDGKVLGKFSKE
jgi:hypothetical protein